MMMTSSLYGYLVVKEENISPVWLPRGERKTYALYGYLVVKEEDISPVWLPRGERGRHRPCMVTAR